MIITDALARRLEAAEATDAAEAAEALCLVDASCGSCVRGVAGGVLAFCGPSSPLTHALGVGMHGPVSGEEVAEIEHFFFSRDAAVSIDLCPHADSSLREVLMNRGYRIADMTNVLVRELRDDENWTVAVLVEPTQEEIEYARTLTCGFFGRDLIT
jgi:hypothetical protein